jgi:hypothetical protein
VSDARTGAAERLLAERGVPGAEVRAEGPDGEIAAIRLPSADLAPLLEDPEAADAVRSLGFRYVAVDLG